MDPFVLAIYVIETSSVLVRTTKAIELLQFGAAKLNEQSMVVDDHDIVTVPLDVDLPFFETTYNTIFHKYYITVTKTSDGTPYRSHGYVLLRFRGERRYENGNTTTTQQPRQLIDAGKISFVSDSDHTSDAFPDNRPIIAPLWNDMVDTTEPLYWRQTTTDISDLTAATGYVRSIYPTFSAFQATWTMVVTWHKFRKYGGSSGETLFLTAILGGEGTVMKENTFQAVLATDGTLSFAIFLYKDVVKVGPTTVGVNAGDGTHFYKLCISRTSAITDIEELTMIQCDRSKKGIVVFRMDSNNPSQGSYDCTPTYSEFDCPVSYFCQENIDNSALIDVVTIVGRPGLAGAMLLDTQKYENGENPNPTDSDCRTPDGATFPITLTFTVDVNAAMPKCGVRVTGTEVKTLEITIRTYYDDERFDVLDDFIFQFTCTSDTVLPRTQTQNVMFSDIEITEIPPAMIPVELQVIVPGTYEVLTEVQIGRNMALRIIFDNKAINIPPYGVYVIDCVIGDTAMFDASIVNIIDDGCVVQQDPTKIWYMSRSFQQKSLIDGLFITDSGIMEATKFANQDSLYFRCTIDVCFFQTSPPNLCNDSCAGTGVVRRRRSENHTASVPDTIVTRVKVLQPYESPSPKTAQAGCIRNSVGYISLSALGVGIFFSLAMTLVLFRQVTRRMKRKPMTN